MRKIRLTEAELHNVIKESVQEVLKEVYDKEDWKMFFQTFDPKQVTAARKRRAANAQMQQADAKRKAELEKDRQAQATRKTQSQSFKDPNMQRLNQMRQTWDHVDNFDKRREHENRVALMKKEMDNTLYK